MAGDSTEDSKQLEVLKLALVLLMNEGYDDIIKNAIDRAKAAVADGTRIEDGRIVQNG